MEAMPSATKFTIVIVAIVVFIIVLPLFLLPAPENLKDVPFSSLGFFLAHRYSTLLASGVAVSAAILAYWNTTRNIRAAAIRSEMEHKLTASEQKRSDCRQLVAIAAALSAELLAVGDKIDTIWFDTEDMDEIEERKAYIDQSTEFLRSLPLTEFYSANLSQIGRLGPFVASAVVWTYKELQVFTSETQHTSVILHDRQSLANFYFTLFATNILVASFIDSYSEDLGTVDFDVAIPFNKISEMYELIKPSADVFQETMFVEWPDQLLAKHGKYRSGHWRIANTEKTNPSSGSEGSTTESTG